MNEGIYLATNLTEGERIRLARLHRYFRQIDLAALAGVSLLEVTNAEKDRFIAPERKARIQKVLGLLEDNGEEGEESG